MDNLYFIRSNGEKILVTENINKETIMNRIQEYVASLNPNFKIYYIRSWATDEGTMYDVGSHTEFFLLSDI